MSSVSSCPPAIQNAVRSVLDAYQLYRAQIDKGSLLPLQAVMREYAAALGGHDPRLVDMALDWLLSGGYVTRRLHPIGAERVYPNGLIEFRGPPLMRAVLTPTENLWQLAANWPSAEIQPDPDRATAGQPEAAPPAGFLGGEQLAEALGVPPQHQNAFLRALSRLRTPEPGKRAQLPDTDWQEVQNARPNSPKFLYRVAAPAVQDLARHYKTLAGVCASRL